MVSRNKLYTQVDELEQELFNLVVPHLEAALDGGESLIFCVSEFNSHAKFKNHVNPDTQNMVLLGKKIIQLKEKLGEPVDGSVAERLCWYCRKWDGLPNPNLTSTRKLAKQLLNEITTNKNI